MKLFCFERVRQDVDVWAAIKKREVSASLFLYLLMLEPGFQMVFLFRIREAVVGLPIFGRFLRRLMWYCSTMWFSSDVGVGLKCAGGFYCPHPFGIVINGQCEIGKNVTVLQGVTLGISHNPLEAPKIFEGSYLGAGSAVLGKVLIGPFAKIGAGAVVLKDVPRDSTVVGVPARLVGN